MPIMPCHLNVGITFEESPLTFLYDDTNQTLSAPENLTVFLKSLKHSDSETIPNK
jgi:hypothetical protein